MEIGGNDQFQFWQNSSEILFTSCAESLIKKDFCTIAALKKILTKVGRQDLASLLQGTRAVRYFSKHNTTIAEVHFIDHYYFDKTNLFATR